jgi:V8-like Glu-specific endopeptidase
MTPKRFPGLLPFAAVLGAALAMALGPAAPPAAAAAVAKPWEDGAVSTVGKILWDTGGGPLGMCSGAIVDAPNGSVIATAAHCVSTPDTPEPPEEAWFVPGYDHDRATYRREGWRVTAFHTPGTWDTTREMASILPHDYAFLTVETRGGRTIQQEHGANRLVFEPVEEGGEVEVLGYPAADPYDGESLHYCAGPTEVLAEGEAKEPNLGGLLLEDCDMTAGSSGGPWLTDYDEGSESGTLLAVMSVGSGQGHVVGRPYPESAKTLFQEAGGKAGGKAGGEA